MELPDLVLLELADLLELVLELLDELCLVRVIPGRALLAVLVDCLPLLEELLQARVVNVVLLPFRVQTLLDGRAELPAQGCPSGSRASPM